MFDIYVINLEERVDRFNHIKEIFKDFNLIRINAIKHNNGAIGCFLSHLECIKIAKQNNMKNIFVIEDDCIPYYIETNFVERICEIKKILDIYDNWDIFLGGPTKVYSYDVINMLNINEQNFVKTKTGSAMHMICYNESSYDFFLSLNPLDNIPIDKCWHNKLVAIIPVPFMAEQIDGYSDIVKLHKSYRNRTMSSNNSLVKYIKDNHDSIDKYYL
jgi:hypothetical protein